MTYLRDWWRRGPVYRYFVDMEPIDRATAIIAIALAFAIGLCADRIFRASDAAFEQAPPAFAVPA